jgi:hypothetical protein
MSAPVASDVIALSAMSEVSTASRYSPWYVQRSVHSSHHASVRASAESASSTGGHSSNDCHQPSVNRSRLPSKAANSAAMVPSSASSATGVVRRNASGPAVATTPSGTRSIHGRMEP